MAYKSSSNADDIELQRLSKDENAQEGTKKEKTVNFASDIDINGNKMPKVNKNVQFSSPQASFDAEVDFDSVKPNLVPNRKREEETVMENLRRRVGDLQMDKNFKIKKKEEDEKEEEKKPLLEDVLDQTTEKDFIIDCLCWHNEYRARHNVPAMSIAMKLCVSAQEWANHLASRNELYYCPQRIFNFGQNIFCCVETCLMLSISGQEVATYWYSSMKRYDFYKKPSLLHTSINAGHFSQIVWKNTKYIGVGKSVSKTGKIFVVAFYYPPGNIIDEFHENVFPPAESKQATRPSSVNSNNK